MPTRADREKFDKMRAAYLELREKYDEESRRLRSKYGPDAHRWATKTERKKIDAIGARMDALSDRFFNLLDAISPRYWRSGAPSHYVLERLSWEDATTSGRLSVRPPTAYAQSERDVDLFVERPYRRP